MIKQLFTFRVKFLWGVVVLLMTTSQLNAQSIIIGTGTANTNGTGSDPIDDFYNGLHYQTVYTATELSNAGLTAGSSLTAIGFEVSEAPGTLANYTVALASTTQSDAATYINPGTTPFTTVIPAFSYVPLVQATGSFDMINFATNFIWDGTSNIVVDICTGPANPYSSPYGGVRVTTSTAGGSFSRADGSPASTVCTQPTGVAATGYSTGILATKPNVKFNYVAGTACSGTPFAGVASASAPVNNGGVCPNTTFTLSTTGSTSASGLTYDWQYNTGSGWFSTGVTTLSYVVTGGINVSTDYRLVVTCNSLPDISNVVPITVNTLLYCYCTPVSICVNEGIENVSFSTINNSSSFCLNPGGYTDYSNLGSLATVVQSQVVNMSVTAHINSSPASAGVWIDYDQSGTFDQAEYTSLGSVSVTIPSGGTTNIFSGNVTIDANALPGMTRMRVRTANQNGITNTSPCITTAAYGEFEDYLITINAGTICTGTPSAGTVTGPSAVCPNVNFTLNATGFTTGFTGFTYLWEVFNSATSTWDPAPGTNNGPTYVATGGIIAPTDYRFSITCTNGNFTSTSSPFPITVNPFINCYCIPTGGTSVNYGINNFSTTGGFTNISNLNSGLSTGGYTDYSSTMTLTTAASSVIGISGSGVNSGYTYGWAVWVDWDHSGTFDPGEKMYNTTSYTNAIPSGVNFTVPTTALQGNTKMRVIANYLNSNPSTETCNAPSGAAEWEDYMVNIGAPPTCLPPTSLGTPNLLATTTDLTWIENNSAGLWQVEYAAAATAFGSGTRVITGLNPYGISGLTQNTAYKFYVRSICSPGDTSAWTGPFNFTTTISCPAPTALTFGSVTGTSANVSWTGSAGSYILEYGPTGYVPGTGATAGAGGTLITNAVSPVSLTSLSPNSGYDVFVRQDCTGSNNGYSSNVSAPLATTGAPINDDICNATVLTLNAPPSWVNTANATTSATDPSGVTGCTGLNNNVWYQFTTNGAGIYNITGYASSVMTVNANQNMSAWAWLYTVTGICPTYTLTQVADLTACNAVLALPATNNAPSNAVRTIPTPALAASTTYYLFLDGNSGSMGNIGISVSTPLGIKLEKISAANLGNTNRVDWNTLGEERTDKFELERSADGKKFVTLHERGANGTPSQYTYTDNSPLNGMNYYRLRMKDAAGAVNYSETVKAFVKSTGFAVSAFPNPVSKNLTVKVNGVQGNDAIVQITDLTGKVISTVGMKRATATINLSGFANGIYLVKYSDADHVETIKITKE